jgi:hypothetical protein
MMSTSAAGTNIDQPSHNKRSRRFVPPINAAASQKTPASTSNNPIVMLSPKLPRKSRLNGRHSARRSNRSRLRLI